jgi:DNA/RNA-binding protein KIN17
MTYIDRDPAAIRRQEELAKRKKEEADEENRARKFIDRQISKSRAKAMESGK